MKWVFILSIIIINCFYCYSKEFNFSMINGSEIGTPKQVVLDNLKSSSIKVNNQNNNNSIYVYNAKKKLYGLKIQNIIIDFKNDTLHAYCFAIPENQMRKVKNGMVTDCNCLFDEENEFILVFDNCCIILDFIDNLVIIGEKFGECKK